MPELQTAVANPGFIRPPRIYLLAVLVGLALQRLWPLPLTGGVAVSVLGILLMAAGLVAFVLTQRAFRSAGTPVPGNQAATTVVRRGPMRFSRNPIYLAFSIIQLGLGLLLHSGWILIMLLPPVAVMQFIVIPREERYMEAKFGAEYLS
ncbi:MAG TPA: isoprenylcysteine carboxylmethyltransferase family protein, partial [Gemmatimonadaceae bacterium]|nr:isoprenylcysteine carboxylmethyltransferase family protein [Gemmatimonadaceae bacterium]